MICLATARPTAYDQQAGRLTDPICVSCTFFSTGSSTIRP